MRVNRVAIIIVHLGNFELTNDCLSSLAQSADAFDVVLVDNGSTDGSVPRLLAVHPQIVVLRSPVNAGFTGGNNLGFHYALEQGYPFVLLLNNDTFVKPGFLTALLRYMDAHPDVGAVQPKIFFHHDRERLWSAGSFFNKLWSTTYTRGLNQQDGPGFCTPSAVDWISGCAFLVRTSVLRDTGLFADNMFLYYEDVDLSFRIRKRGWQLAYVPDAVIYHIAGASGKQKGSEGNILPFVHYYNLRNRLWFIKKYTAWYYLPTALFANGAYAMALVGYFLLRGRKQKLRYTLRAIMDGVRGQIRYTSEPVTKVSLLPAEGSVA